MADDWTQPPLPETFGDLGPALRDARLRSVRHDGERRRVTLTFDLPEDAGPTKATFVVEEATHLLAFGYLSPAVAFDVGDDPERAVALIGDWARRGLVTVFDPFAPPTELIVQIARLHASGEGATLVLEGYGVDETRLVWWEMRASGARVASV